MFDRTSYILEDTSLKNDLLKLFKKEDELLILDIGGCEGEESIRYSRLFPNSSIFIFEPLPKNQELITNNILNYNSKRVKMLPVAVSDEDGYAEFYVSSGRPDNEDEKQDWDFGNKSSSLLEPETSIIHKWLNFKEKIKVSTMKLDTFFSEYNINKIDFIHMDVQGAELKVLLGATNSLKKIKSIWLEVADKTLYKNQVLRKDIEEFMKDNGFTLVKTEMTGIAGDQLYINKNHFGFFEYYYKIFKLKY